MFSFFKLASVASVALSALVSAAPLQPRDNGNVWLAFNHVVVTDPGDTVWMTGSIPQLKNWAGPPNAIAMSKDHYSTQYPVWWTNLTVPANTQFEYKYIWKKADGTVSWETGDNRVINTGNFNGNVQSNWNIMKGAQPLSLNPVCFTFHQSIRPGLGDLYMVGSDPALGNWNPAKGMRMASPGNTNPGLTFYKLSYCWDTKANFQYKFVLKNKAGQYIWEGGPNRAVNYGPGSYNIYDIWRTDADSSPLYGGGPAQGGASIFFTEKVKTAPGEKVYVVGSPDYMGAWDATAAIPLSSLGYTDADPTWWTLVNVQAGNIQYKFIKKLGNKVTWEGGANHVIRTIEGTYHRADGTWQN